MEEYFKTELGVLYKGDAEKITDADLNRFGVEMELPISLAKNFANTAIS